MTRRRTFAISAALVAVIAVACGGGTGATETPPIGGPSTITDAPLPSGMIEVTGVVELGVEQGCRLLRTATELYQLMGSVDPLLAPGSRVTVRGTPRSDIATTCQQGTPLQVVQVRAG
jgi:hypothetical protein